MRRDWDMVRMIVLALADAEPGEDPKYDFTDVHPDKFAYHLHLVWKAGLAEG